MGLWDEEVVPARSGFLRFADFFRDPDDIRPGEIGRLLLIKPLASGERESTLQGQQGKLYPWVECDIAILDGPVSEKIEEVPFVYEGFQFSGATLSGRSGILLPKLRTGGTVLGRASAHRSKGFNTLGWGLEKPTPADFEIAKAFQRTMQERERAKEQAAIRAQQATDPWSGPSGNEQQDAAPPWARR